MWKKLNKSEKVMVVIIIMLIIGIITRWGYVKEEASESVMHYFRSDTTHVAK